MQYGMQLMRYPHPIWDCLLMTVQIVVRLPDETVEFLDRLVAEKKAASRAEIVVRALERERRRDMAARDAVTLAESGEDPDLAGLIRYVTGAPVDPPGIHAAFDLE